jgi:hypothetical protein
MTECRLGSPSANRQRSVRREFAGLQISTHTRIDEYASGASIQGRGKRDIAHRKRQPDQRA